MEGQIEPPKKRMPVETSCCFEGAKIVTSTIPSSCEPDKMQMRNGYQESRKTDVDVAQKERLSIENATHD
jgi:hypothetical protein